MEKGLASTLGEGVPAAVPGQLRHIACLRAEQSLATPTRNFEGANKSETSRKNTQKGKPAKNCSQQIQKTWLKAMQIVWLKCCAGRKGEG